MDAPTAAIPTRLRRGLAVLALVAAAAITVATIGWVRHDAAARAAAVAAYDLDAAMMLAGAVVPEDIESFYFFVLEPDALGESGELADKLLQAAREHDFLGIAGADADHNRDVLRLALAAHAPGTLAGLVVIYVGPQDHQPEVQSLIDATGAELRFVVYRPGIEQTI